METLASIRLALEPARPDAGDRLGRRVDHLAADDFRLALDHLPLGLIGWR